MNEEVVVRRQWNDWRKGKVRLDRIAGVHWDVLSGGVGTRAPRPFLMGYVWCNEVEGEIAHSCTHGEGPHSIKVTITKIDNDRAIYAKLSEMVMKS